MQFINLNAQCEKLRDKLDRSISIVLDQADFINGASVGKLERALSEFNGDGHTVACANGTDALTIVGMAEGVGPGKAVFVPAFTFVASAGALALLGATPFFVDIDPVDFNICPRSLEVAVRDAVQQGLQPAMIVAVDLFGQPARYQELRVIADKYDLVLVSDAAQAFGAVQHSTRSRLGFADWVTTSFFPAKPLGCYGDGGAILCRTEAQADLVKSIAQHGKGSEKYDNIRIGMNSRLDTVQAAVLLCKLEIFAEELDVRQQIAQALDRQLVEIVETPKVRPENQSSWAQYTIRLENTGERSSLQQHMRSAGIPTAVYYPQPLNLQTGFCHYPVVSSGVEHSVRASNEVLSLPMHPYLTSDEVDKITGEVGRWKWSSAG